MAVSGIGTAAAVAKSLIGMFFPDKTEEDNQTRRIARANCLGLATA